jgi:hypothetical protein
LARERLGEPFTAGKVYKKTAECRGHETDRREERRGAVPMALILDGIFYPVNGWADLCHAYGALILL